MVVFFCLDRSLRGLRKLLVAARSVSVVASVAMVAVSFTGSEVVAA